MEVIPHALSPEENFYAGIADAESTALALVIEALINLGQPQEEIDLEEIISAPGFASLEEAVRQAQSNNQDILTLSSIITQAQAIADYIVNPPSPTPAPTPAPAPTPSPTPTPTPVPSSAREITAYKFEAGKNTALSSDVTGTIDSVNHTVSLTVPYGTGVTSLVATFTLSQGATAKVGDISQVSGTTANDFTIPVIYTVIAEDNSIQDWTITVSIEQLVRYVATDGDNTNVGSEAYPWKTIQYALNTISSSGTIMVKDGTYNESITFPSDKVIILRSVNGAFSTIIIYHYLDIVTCSGSTEGTTLEGFTITHKINTSGKGINITSGYLTIKNCLISNNYTTDVDYGGGICNYGTLTITGSTIFNNYAYDGGGIYNKGTLTITNSTLSNNSASDGGGIYNKGTLTIEEGSTISHNSAATCGSGIYNYGTLTITNSTLSHNSASDGGGIYNKGTLTIEEGSTISHNSASSGGGIYNFDGGKLTITSSTISNNSSLSGGGIYNFDGGELTITGSTISDNSADDFGGGIYNKGTLTIEEDSIISDNHAGFTGGGIENDYGKLTITGSTISDNSADVYGGGIYLKGTGTIVIGGSSGTDTDNFNNFTDNYKTGSTPSANQH
jgi:predicted outer membrane repeat protein